MPMQNSPISRLLVLCVNIPIYQQYQLIAIDISASFIALVDLNLNINGGIKIWY